MEAVTRNGKIIETDNFSDWTAEDHQDAAVYHIHAISYQDNRLGNAAGAVEGELGRDIHEHGDLIAQGVPQN